MKASGLILRIAIIVGLVALLGFIVEIFEPAIFELTNYHLADTPLSTALILIAVITFFGFMWMGEILGGEWALNRGGMRIAITVAIVTVYLVLMTYVVFFRFGADLPPLTSNLLTSFTTIVAIVIPFYFGTSAYVHAKAEENEKRTAGGETNAEPKAEQKSV